MNNSPNMQSMIVIEGRATYERIVSLIRDMEPEEAIQQILNFLKVYPEFAQAHNDAAVIFYQSGNPLKALAHHEKAHKLDPRNITFRKNLADFYCIELDWVDDAIQMYLEILKDNPFDVETLNALGAINQRAGRRSQARQYYTRALQQSPLSTEARQALQQLGPALLPPDAGRPAPLQTPVHEDAIAPSRIAATTYRPEPPPSPEQRYRSAADLAGAGRPDEAVRALEILVSDHPDFAMAHNDLGVLKQQQGDLAGSRHHHEEAVRLQPANPTFQKNLADLLYIGCREKEKALQIYVQLLFLSPQDQEILKAIAHICLESGKLDDARIFIERLLAINPLDNDAREALSLLGGPGKLPQPEVSRTADELHAEAMRLANEGQGREAAAILEKLVMQYDDNALGHNDLGVLRYQLGDKEGARRAYERAVELQPANANFRKNLADLYFTDFGMTDEAIRIYLELFREQPRDIETLAGLGHICATISRPEEAKSFYRRALEIEPWNIDTRNALQELERI